jgi:hypothetical protein
MFRHGYHGVRGVGKTVLVDAVAAVAKAELDWPVVSHQAIADENLLAAVLAKLPAALDQVSWRGARALRGFDKQVTLGVNLVVRAEATLSRRAPAMPADASAVIEQVVVRLGEAARDKGRGVLVVVDEVHAAPVRPDLAAFARVLQVVNRRQLPVAVLLAGLPGTPAHLAKAGTFTERLTMVRLGDLGPSATRLALVQPAAECGVHFDNAALDALVEWTAGYPYFVQLFGFWAWEAAAGADRVTLDHVRVGAREARRQAATSLYGPRWERLSPLERAYLTAVAAEGDEAGTGSVAAALQRTHGQLSSARAALISEHHLLEAAGHGRVRFTIPGFSAWLRATRSARERRR